MREITSFHFYVESITPVDLIKGWIIGFWNNGMHVLEYLYITLQYTDMFFTESDVVQAIPLAEQELGLDKGKLYDEWHEHLLHPPKDGDEETFTELK